MSLIVKNLLTQEREREGERGKEIAIISIITKKKKRKREKRLQKINQRRRIMEMMLHGTKE